MPSRPLWVALLWSATAAAALADSNNDTVAHDLFVASDRSVLFTLNVATESNDIYFSLVGPSANSWLSVGFGSDRMDGALMFIAYASASGTNVTVSPRLPSDHSEPVYSSEVQIQVLPGSGVRNNTLTANVRCSNCRGNIANSKANVDVTSTSQKMCYASGPSGSIRSDSKTADTKRHSHYGSFTMNLQSATGVGGIAAVPQGQTTDSGAAETTSTTDHDFSLPLHAALMIFSFLGLMPLGIYILRVLGWVKWHGINQALASALALLGGGLGIYIGRMYNRSKNFNTAHQLLGLVVLLALAGQFVLGFMHHRIYKRTGTTTKMAPVHVWLGRAVIPAGIVDAFLGFPLALSPHNNYWLAGLVAAVAVSLAVILLWKQWRNARRAKNTPMIAPGLYPGNHAGSRTQGLAGEHSGSENSDIHLQHLRNGHATYGNDHAQAYEAYAGPPVESWGRL